jgi:hypothetical protein
MARGNAEGGAPTRCRGAALGWDGTRVPPARAAAYFASRLKTDFDQK